MDFTSLARLTAAALTWSAPHSSAPLTPLRLTGSLCTFCIVISKMPQLTHHARFPAYYLHTCFTNSIRALPCHLVTWPQQLKIILGAAVIYYTTLTSPPNPPPAPFPCHEPSRLRLSDKLTEVTDNSFDSKLQPCVVPRAPLAGVCCDRRARRSSPTVISVGPDDKDIMQRVFKHEADM